VNTFDDFLAGRIGIRCDTREQYDRLMQECEKREIRWPSSRIATFASYDETNHAGKKRTKIAIRGNKLYYRYDDDQLDDCIEAVPFSALCAELEKPATPYDGRGKHTVGDLFEVVLGDAFNPGDIVRLIYDDKSEFPEFERVSDGKQQFYFWYKVKPITPAARKIVITADGRVTTARLIVGKRTIKTATATCSPSDEFSFETGARLAFDRLVLCKEREESKTGLQLAIYHIEDALKAMK